MADLRDVLIRPRRGDGDEAGFLFGPSPVSNPSARRFENGQVWFETCQKGTAFKLRDLSSFREEKEHHQN